MSRRAKKTVLTLFCSPSFAFGLGRLGIWGNGILRAEAGHHCTPVSANQPKYKPNRDAPQKGCGPLALSYRNGCCQTNTGNPTKGEPFAQEAIHDSDPSQGHLVERNTPTSIPWDFKGRPAFLYLQWHPANLLHGSDHPLPGNVAVVDLRHGVRPGARTVTMLFYQIRWGGKPRSPGRN
jgi:hypothetical protein